jgi:hypothetical protein
MSASGVIRDRGEPAASQVTFAVPPKAEVNSEHSRRATCPTGKSVLVNQKKIHFVQPSREKYFCSVFRKFVVLSPHPAST